MAFLRVVKGTENGKLLELQGERNVLGRHPNCQIVLDSPSVSRHHAQILESHGHFYLEDLRSRNRTYLNGNTVEGRAELKDGDELKVCEVLFRFHLTRPSSGRLPADPAAAASTVAVGEDGSVKPKKKPRPVQSDSTTAPEPLTEEREPGDGTSDTKSSIISTLDVRSSSKLRLDMKPEAKLQAVLEISKALSQSLDVKDLIPRILDRLLITFPQSDHGVVVLKDEDTGELKVESARSKSSNKSELVWSRTMIEKAIESGEAILSVDAQQDSDLKLAESVNSLRIHSMICVPLENQSGTIGAIQIVTRNAKKRFDAGDLDVLASICSQVELAIVNSRLHEEVLKQKSIQRDLEVAMQIQQGFLPHNRPKVNGYEFHDYYEPAQSVGGDYFDYVPLPNNRYAIAIADVAGKGVPAALLMARLYSAARFHLLMHQSVAEAMTGLNEEIASSGLGFRFITCVIAILDPERNALTIANAGHMPPLVRRANGIVEPAGKEISGMPLGVMPKQQFKQVTVPLAAGDTMLTFTDGITEAMNAKNDLYGTKMLTRFLAGGPAGAEALVQGILQDVEQFSGELSQSDDMCLVCLRRVA